MTDPDTLIDWYTGTNPDVLLALVCPQDTDYASMVQRGTLPLSDYRRIQFFACGSVRTVWDLLPREAQTAIMVRERFAAGRATDADLHASALRRMGLEITAWQHATASAAYAAGFFWGAAPPPLNWYPTAAALSAAKAHACRAAGQAPPSGRAQDEWHTTWNLAYAAARAYQAELVRDIFPPPRAAALRLERAWLTDTVMTLARHADDTGEYGALPILADALQDAGCDNEILLDRCLRTVRHSLSR